MWTQAWRRMNKKGKDENLGGKKKARRAVKVIRAIVGATVEELKSKRQATKPKVLKSLIESFKYYYY
jgi:hypothetical protein